MNHNPKHSLNYNYKRGCRCSLCSANHVRYYERQRERYLAQNKERHLKNRDADNQYRKEWYRKNADAIAVETNARYEDIKERTWVNYLKRTYNLTSQQYLTMFQGQKGLCLLCNKSEPTFHRLSVDHNHTTNRVRGLLCKRCNSILGVVENEWNLIARMINYLEDDSRASLS